MSALSRVIRDTLRRLHGCEDENDFVEIITKLELLAEEEERQVSEIDLLPMDERVILFALFRVNLKEAAAYLRMSETQVDRTLFQVYRKIQGYSHEEELVAFAPPAETQQEPTS